MFYHHIQFFFFFNDTATTEIYTLSLHDALPISIRSTASACFWSPVTAGSPAPSTRRSSAAATVARRSSRATDRKSTRLNSSHSQISYAVFCLKKKKQINNRILINITLQRVHSST